METGRFKLKVGRAWAINIVPDDSFASCPKVTFQWILEQRTAKEEYKKEGKKNWSKVALTDCTKIIPCHAPSGREIYRAGSSVKCHCSLIRDEYVEYFRMHLDAPGALCAGTVVESTLEKELRSCSSPFWCQ